MEEIPILGVVIGREQVQMETNKVKAVKKWKTPTKIKEVESVVATTRHSRTNDLTTSKALSRAIK